MPLMKRTGRRLYGKSAKKARYSIPASVGSSMRASSGRSCPYLKTTLNTYIGAWGFGTASVSDYWRYFTTTPSAWNGFSDLASVFDEYKVHSIEYTFVPRYTEHNADTATASIAPTVLLHSIIDPGSTVIPTGIYGATSLNAFLANGDVKTSVCDKIIKVSYKPKVSMQLFGGSTATSVINATWAKTSDTGTDHRGFHMYMHQNNFSTVAGNTVLDMFVKVNLEFRSMK